MNQHHQQTDGSVAVGSSSSSVGIWGCDLFSGTVDGKDTLKTVDSLCTGLKNARDFWIWGHDGHYPKSQRAAEKDIKVKRWFCTLQNQQIPGPHAVAVTQSDLLELPLICLHSSFRGVAGESVDLLNNVLGLGGLQNKRVKMISSNDPRTIGFYKSLTIDCQCEDFGKLGQPVKGFLFQAQAPVTKRLSYYHIDPSTLEVSRIIGNMCMSQDEFTTLMGQLPNVQQLNQAGLVALLTGPAGHWESDPQATVLLSDLVKEQPQWKLKGGAAKLQKYMGENPINCT